MDRTVAAVLGEERESGLQENGELLRRHLARAHHEFIMLNGAFAADIAGNFYVVRWICDHRLSHVSAEQCPIGALFERTATDHDMVAQQPDIAGPRDPS